MENVIKQLQSEEKKQLKLTKMEATLIMLDKPILVSEETPYPIAYHIKKKEILIIKGVGEQSLELFHSKGYNYPKECNNVIAGHEGTKRLTFQLSDEDAKGIGYVDVKGLAALAAVAKYPTLHNAEFKSDAAENVLTKLCRSAFELGAETYASLTPKKYTEEDMCDLVEQLKDYTYEGRIILGDDEREPKEFVEIFLKSRKPQQFKVECTETENEITITKIL